MTVRYYERVSTKEQNLERQERDIKAFITLNHLDNEPLLKYADKMSGKTANRPQLQQMLDDLKEGDTVIVYSLDRLSRSSLDLLQISHKILEEKKAVLFIVDKKIDTTDAYGRMFMTIVGAVAEFEREMIHNRVMQGVANAKEKGLYKGRKKGSIKIKGSELKRFIQDYQAGLTKTRLSEIYKVPRSTVYNWIKDLKEKNMLE